jgi:hypothetical protein
MTRALSAKAFQLQTNTIDAFTMKENIDGKERLVPSTANDSVNLDKMKQTSTTTCLPLRITCPPIYKVGAHKGAFVSLNIYRRKHRVTGLTNRTQFLNQQQFEQISYDVPSNHRSLAISTAFGTPRVQAKMQIPLEYINTEQHVIKFPAMAENTLPLRSIADVLNIEKQIIPNIPRQKILGIERSEKATRYSANTEWGRNTLLLTQGDPKNHHYIAERVKLNLSRTAWNEMGLLSSERNAVN